MDKKFWATAFTLSGTMIGAGILGLPYVFSKSGFFIGLIWLIAIGLMMIFINLCLAEVTLRTKGKHHLVGYAEKYLGKKAKMLTFFAMMFGIYAAILAYLIGEGESLSRLLPGNIHPVLLGTLFWFFMTMLLAGGLRELKKVETWGVLAIIVIVVGIFINFVPHVELSNLQHTNFQHFLLPFGVVLFSLMGFSAIPELRQEIAGKEHLFKKAIILGGAIPIVLYILFSIIFIGILGPDIQEVATLSFGPLINLLGIFTMMTSFFSLSYVLRDTYHYDMNYSHQRIFLFATLLPLILYLLVSAFRLVGFVTILGIGGVVSGGLSGIVILAMNLKSKKHTRNGKRPEIKMKLGNLAAILLSSVLLAGIVFQFLR